MYLLTRKNLNLTAKLIAKELGIQKKFEVQDTPPLIRWGCSDSIFRGTPDTRFNSAELIRIISNKRSLSSALAERNISHIELNTGVPERFPVAVRRELQGSKGSGIIICKSQQEFMPYSNYFWSYWYKFKSEYGVHLLGGEVVKIFRKKWAGEGTEPTFPIRNTDNNYHYFRIDMEGRFSKLVELMYRVYEVLPIEMCRFDVGLDSNSGKYVIIEGNTAPGLSTNKDTRSLYVEFLKEKLF